MGFIVKLILVLAVVAGGVWAWMTFHPGAQQPAQQHSGQPGTTGQSSGQSGKAAPPHMNAPQNNAPQNNAPAQQGGSNRLQGQSR